MRPHGVIYQASWENQGFKNSFEHKEIFIQIPERLKPIYKALEFLGVVLIYIAVAGFLFSYRNVFSQEVAYQKSRVNQALTVPQTLVVAQVNKEESVSPIDDNLFFITIPKINAQSQVIPNVDITNEKEYLAALEEGVAHASGSYFPGEGKTVFLFAHSTDSPLNVVKYNAVFYLLRKLEKGDQITVFFKGKEYIYEVSEKVYVDAKDISWLTKEFEEERLILQTCDPPAITLRRLLVIASPV